MINKADSIKVPALSEVRFAVDVAVERRPSRLDVDFAAREVRRAVNAWLYSQEAS